MSDRVRRTAGRAAALALGIALLSGCVSVSQGTKDVAGGPEAWIGVGNLRQGETTVRDVVRQFGPPREVRRPEPGVEVFVYGYAHRDLDQLLIMGLPVWTGGTSESVSYELEFRDGVLAQVVTRHSPLGT